MATIHGIEVKGLDVDGETRCAHYHRPNDIVAIKFRCCGQWFSCHRCHSALANHAVQVWPKSEFDHLPVLCGSCGHHLTVRQYLDSQSICPNCSRTFNPGCSEHRHLYFDVAQ